MQGGASEAARQIVEFEELVSRLDRINDVVVRPPTATSTSVPPPSPPTRRPSHFAATSLPYEPVVANRPADRDGQQQQPVRVHTGIDEDLRLILEMDPSIVDRTPAPVILPDNYPVAQPLRATRPQGWYCAPIGINFSVSQSLSRISLRANVSVGLETLRDLVNSDLICVQIFGNGTFCRLPYVSERLEA